MTSCLQSGIASLALSTEEQELWLPSKHWSPDNLPSWHYLFTNSSGERQLSADFLLAKRDSARGITWTQSLHKEQDETSSPDGISSRSIHYGRARCAGRV